MISTAISASWSVLRPFIRPCMLQKARAGAAISAPWSIWDRLPESVWGRLEWGLLIDVENTAEAVFQNGHELSQLFRADEFKSRRTWAATPLTLLVLWNTVQRRKPECILEFGSGLSTLVFAHFSRQQSLEGRESPRIISIEHDEQWMETTRARLDSLDLADRVELVHAPLSHFTHVSTSHSMCYNPDRIAEAAPSDVNMCFIDGPPQQVGRGGCLPLVEPYLSSRATILMDDSARRSERGVIRGWNAAYRRNISCIRGLFTLRGLAQLEWQNERAIQPCEMSIPE